MSDATPTPPESPPHTPLDALRAPGLIRTAGRLMPDGRGRWWLTNAHASARLVWCVSSGAPAADLVDGALVRVEGVWTGAQIEQTRIVWAQPPRREVPHGDSPGAAARAWAAARAAIRRHLDQRGFTEVHTPCWIAEPGTDLYLSPVQATFEPDGMASPAAGRHRLDGWLHTSPELQMKALLSRGMERIYQIGPVWRNGEVSPQHLPEFTLLEWYRAWAALDEVIADTEHLVRAVCGDQARVGVVGPGESPRVVDLRGEFVHLTMRELVHEACGFDLLDALDYRALQDTCRARNLLSPRRTARTDELYRAPTTGPEAEAAQAALDTRWEELFFELQVTHLDPLLARLGPVVVTRWPTQLAVLAQRAPDDPRVAERFELYVGGVELANGFQELTDPVEQRARFADDQRRRAALGKPPLPMPERFLAALERGMPPSAGVALGLDRLVLLATGAPSIHHIALGQGVAF